MPDDRWAKKLTLYMTMFDGLPVWQRPLRARVGAVRRWENEIRTWCQSVGLEKWAVAAESRDQWSAMAGQFAEQQLLK